MSFSLNGTDIQTLGAFLVKGGDYDLLSFPERKEPVKNNWFEHDGLDVDLTAVYFKAKTIRLKYGIMAANATQLQSRLNTLANLHFSTDFCELYIPAFQHTYQLRVLNFQEYIHQGGYFKDGRKTGYLEVEYSADNPTQFFTVDTTPIEGAVSHTNIKLNGFDLSRFGIVVQEAYGSVLKPRSPKKGLVIETENQNGSIADTEFVPKKEARKIILKCTFLSSKQNFKRNWSALFNQLTKAGTLKIEAAGQVIDCYYHSMSDFTKHLPLSHRAYFTFNLNLQEL